MFAKAALILCLFPGLLASSRIVSAARSTSHPTRSALPTATASPRYSGRDDRTANAARQLQRRQAAAAARSAERKLLLLAPGKRALRRFVDQTTGLVKRNVAAHCTRLRGKLFRHKLPRFVCRVWTQPASPSSGISVVAYTKHHAFRVKPYHRRHRRG